MMEERYEVLDEQGQKTGQILTTTQVHEQELIHASSFVWIYNSRGEVLLQLRAKDKRCFPGVWDVSVAGHISAGSNPVDTAVKETAEEINMDIKPEELIQVAYFKDVNVWIPDKTHPEFDWVYILHKDVDISSLKAQEDELTDVRWIAIEEYLEALQAPDASKTYAVRNMDMYKPAFRAIGNNLGKIWSEI